LRNTLTSCLRGGKGSDGEEKEGLVKRGRSKGKRSHWVGLGKEVRGHSSKKKGNKGISIGERKSKTRTKEVRVH